MEIPFLPCFFKRENLNVSVLLIDSKVVS